MRFFIKYITKSCNIAREEEKRLRKLSILDVGIKENTTDKNPFNKAVVRKRTSTNSESFTSKRSKK